MIMMKEGGYSLSDIRGAESVTTSTRPPTLLEEARGVDHRRPSAAAAVSASVFFVAGAGALGAAVAAALAFAGVLWFLLINADPGKRVEREKASSPGMPETEVQRRVAQVEELMEYRADEAEKEANKAGKGGSHGHVPTP